MAESRECEQCGTAFAPRREHARFCSTRCRVAWNRANKSDLPAEAGALEWAMTAMAETIDRLPGIGGLDRQHAFALIGEAVWWVTIVDGTLVRYHPEAYDRELAARPAAERELLEETLGGLRFVRNQMGHEEDDADFIRARALTGDDLCPGGWTWSELPEPAFASLSSRGLEWERARYRAYQSELAGQPVCATFQRAVDFLKLAADPDAFPS